jgi:phosphoglycerate dehydrogenase-like enzyme
MATHKHIRVAGPLIVENPFYELPEQAMTPHYSGESVEQQLRQIDRVTAAS